MTGALAPIRRQRLFNRFPEPSHQDGREAWLRRSESAGPSKYTFPDIHWQKIRTNNALERTMKRPAAEHASLELSRRTAKDPWTLPKKELVGLIDGVRESAQSWRELRLDLKRRGLSTAPELAGADGALGFWQAIEQVWPQTRGPRCWVHKTANVLGKSTRAPQPDRLLAQDHKTDVQKRSAWCMIRLVSNIMVEHEARFKSAGGPSNFLFTPPNRV